MDRPLRTTDDGTAWHGWMDIHFTPIGDKRLPTKAEADDRNAR
jgi:hypothetical protein